VRLPRCESGRWRRHFALVVCGVIAVVPVGRTLIGLRDSGLRGQRAEQVDATARDVLAAEGLAEAFVHRTGHGIGLDGHEEPYIVGGNDLVLEPGMTFSIEPGIYLPGRHGARIEDIVVCTDSGVERFNLTSRELALLP